MAMDVAANCCLHRDGLGGRQASFAAFYNLTTFRTRLHRPRLRAVSNDSSIDSPPSPPRRWSDDWQLQKQGIARRRALRPARPGGRSVITLNRNSGCIPKYVSKPFRFNNQSFFQRDKASKPATRIARYASEPSLAKCLFNLPSKRLVVFILAV